jgi:hypothetical protein
MRSLACAALFSVSFFFAFSVMRGCGSNQELPHGATRSARGE